MHMQSEEVLQNFALELIELFNGEEREEAWPRFLLEANERYSAEDDGPREQYSIDVAEIFEDALTVVASWPS